MSKVKETFITLCRFTEGEDRWEVFSERASHQRQFTRLFGEPAKVRGIGWTWYVPIRDLAIKRRRKSTLTEEQKRVATERLGRLRVKKS